MGYKVNSERAVQFRKWATGIIESFTFKVYAMDDERLKHGITIFLIAARAYSTWATGRFDAYFGSNLVCRPAARLAKACFSVIRFY